MIGSSRGRDEEKVNNAADYDSPNLWMSSRTPYIWSRSYIDLKREVACPYDMLKYQKTSQMEGGRYDSLRFFLLVSMPQNPLVFRHRPPTSIPNQFGRARTATEWAMGDTGRGKGLNYLLKNAEPSSTSGNQWAWFMVYLDMHRKVSGQYSKPQGPKTSVGGRGNDLSGPITVSTTISSLSHFSRAYYLHQKWVWEVGRD
jgi:hypothetical protein